MAELFRKQNDPFLYLEREVKEPEFIKFKNQYFQSEAEEAIAYTLCAYLKEPLKVQISKSLGREMVKKMKASAALSSKQALKVKVLTDLLEEDIFENYMLYVTNVRKCLENRIRDYTIKYCDEITLESSTRLQQATKDEVTRLLNVVEEVVIAVAAEVEKEEKRNKTEDESSSDVKLEIKIQNWLSKFCKNQKFRRQLGVGLEPKDLFDDYDESQTIDVKAFVAKVKEGLKELEETLHKFYQNVRCEREMLQWKDKPHEILKSLIGCTAQCPFCGEQCDLSEPDHTQNNGPNHKVEVHRMDCLAGWRERKSQVMVTNLCPVIVDSERQFYKSDDTLHPYRRYQEVYKLWSIPPDKSAKDCSYWQWFVGKYKDSIATSFNAKPPVVPPEWSRKEKAKIVKDLEQVYNVKCE